MIWHELYSKDKEPNMNEIANYIGDAKDLWLVLTSYIETTYNTKPKLTYSGCGMKPGWNIKYQKSGQAFGTFYPEKNSFSAMVVISYKLVGQMDEILPTLSNAMAELWSKADDYMRIGKWMMIQFTDQIQVEDYKKILAVKLPPKKI